MVRSALVVAAITAWVSRDPGRPPPDLAREMKGLQDAASSRLIDLAREQALSGAMSSAETVVRMMGAGAAAQARSTPASRGSRTPESVEVPSGR